MTIHETARALLARDNALILTHARPDGDTVGSAAALCLGLRALGKTAHVLKNPDMTARYLPYAAGCLWEGAVPDEAFLIAVDVAAPELLPEAFRPLESYVALVIDHHPTNSGYGRARCVRPDRASTGEIIFEILTEMGAPLTPEIALPLYLAVSTDTGCFRYSNTTARTHRVAAALLDTGIPAAEINREMFERKTRQRLRLESLVMGEMEFLDGGRVGLCRLTLEMLEKTGASEDDTDNISALPRRVEGVEIGVTIREMSGHICKISVRTSKSWEANRICARLGGGGHARAGGCQVEGDVAEARRRILKAIAEVTGAK